MDKKSLYYYYYSMIVYLFGSVPFVLYAILIKPVGKLYHEKPFTMTSPVFGNFGVFEEVLLALTLIFIAISIILFIISIMGNKKKKKKISTATLITPLILYAFTFIALGAAVL